MPDRLATVEFKEDGLQVSDTLDRLAKSVRCLKYEVKKIKNDHSVLHETLTAGEKGPSDETAGILHALTDRISSLEAKSNLTLRDNRCLKYEVRHLKARLADEIFTATTASSVHPDIAQDNSHLLDDLHDGVLAAVRDEFWNEMRCVKYEVKKLKSVCASFAEADLRHDIHCLKFEVNRLKRLARNSAEVDVANRSHKSFAFFTSRLSIEDETVLRALAEEVAAISNAIDGVSFEKMLHDIKCLKFEFKRHVSKEQTWMRTVERRGSDRSEVGTSKGNVEIMTRQIEELWQVVSGLQQQRAAQVSQVFVDLPVQPACRVVFRARQRRT
jgi:regulator of replication initiation timing